MPGPKKRRDTKTVASKLQLAFLLIPQGNGKLPSQFLPHFLAMILPQMRNELRVAVGYEPVSARFQLLPALDVIEQLAVEDHGDVPVFISNRLLAIGQTDNA